MSRDKTNGLDRKALKQKYLECFGVRVTNMVIWQEAVKGLVHQGVSRQTMMGWATAAGYSKGYVSSLLSRIFVSLGLRVRGKGAGRKPSRDTLELLTHAREQYGERCLKVLRAAWRAGKAQVAANSPQREGMTANVAPQLGQMSKTATPNPHAWEILPEYERRQSVAGIFKRSFDAPEMGKSKTTRK